ncbi:unnamed protein product [Vitrella brassicaformis CCMP3155]|uniref:Uncharacterized protein n=1 Tax=Vitrella brassicaformis (strain CCMP3155) TaxID=1169540 RepID=A0A0G4EA66_VITBC|nr:unnamed protein product [Vitrella brassicaformis CCMP3155]|eukprot:CEL92842.1 unnamed protein product [Vitrella brassicaformis CCMP3155]
MAASGNVPQLVPQQGGGQLPVQLPDVIDGRLPGEMARSVRTCYPRTGHGEADWLSRIRTICILLSPHGGANQQGLVELKNALAERGCMAVEQVNVMFVPEDHGNVDGSGVASFFLGKDVLPSLRRLEELKRAIGHPLVEFVREEPPAVEEWTNWVPM